MNFLEEWKRLAKEKGKNNRIEDDKREARKVSQLVLICFDQEKQSHCFFPEW